MEKELEKQMLKMMIAFLLKGQNLLTDCDDQIEVLHEIADDIQAHYYKAKQQ